MISGLDSAYAPTAAQVIAAQTAGHRAWAGYFAGPNILNGWAWSDFQRVRAGGLATWAYVSGWSDPAAMRVQSDLWGVPICLDVEGGIRGFGAWVQPWLTVAAPCGLYGNPPIHAGIAAAFHVCAAYPGYEPAVTWPAYIARPSTPCAWQWRGSHNEFGITVDSVWADNAFAAAFSAGGGTIGGDMTPDEHNMLQQLHDALVPTAPSVASYVTNTLDVINIVNGKIDALKAAIAALPAAQGGGLTPAQAQELSNVAATLGRIETALKGA